MRVRDYCACYFSKSTRDVVAFVDKDGMHPVRTGEGYKL